MIPAIPRWALRLDRRCARLNAGLAAVAVVLAGILLATATGRAWNIMLGNSALAVPLDLENPALDE